MNPSEKAAQREARLAARLKANLARRKDQARGRETDAQTPPHPDPLPGGEKENINPLPTGEREG